MSKVVYFSLPAHGHINPSLPVIAELVRRGTQVHCYSLERFRDPIENTGATFHDYGARFEFPESGPGPFSALDTAIEALIELTRVVLEDHLSAVRSMQPTCIMHDAFSPWGKFVAQSLDLPTVVSVSSIAVNERIAMSGGQKKAAAATGQLIAERMPQWKSDLAALSERFGLPLLHNPFGLMHAYGNLNLVYTSRAFQPDAGAFEEERFKFVGPSVFPRLDAPVFPFEALDGRPLLYIALGTVYRDRGPFFRTCIEAFANTRWQVVMAVGHNFDTEELTSLPENFLVRKSVPQLEILPRAALFVTHGGMNSVSEALFYDVPLLVIPQGADQFWIAQRVAELGAGRSLADGEITAATLRLHVEQIATEPSFAQAAAEIGQSLRSAGGAQRAVHEMEAFLVRTEVKKG
jgi:MGT family glycosyltransferase